MCNLNLNFKLKSESRRELESLNLKLFGGPQAGVHSESDWPHWQPQADSESEYYLPELPVTASSH